MNLDAGECMARLQTSKRAVFGTVHGRRGVDAVPVVFAVRRGQIVLPIDTIKAKRGTRPQRLVNLAADPRCVLLADCYEADWTRLWWVRVHATGVESDLDPEDVTLFAERYPQYRAPGAVTRLIVLTPTEIRGWAA